MSQSLTHKVFRRLVRAYLSIGGFKFWQRWGFHVLPVHFYSPIPDTRSIPEDTWEQVADLNGRIDLADDLQLSLLHTLAQRFRNEYDAFPTQPTDDATQFYTATRTFNCVDAQMLYAMVRHYKPSRVIEVGSGFSTLLINQALQASKAEDSEYNCDFTAIEPYPDYIIGERATLQMLPNLTALLDLKVQQVDLEIFSKLDSGDLLFIDSSHTVRTGGDTLHEMLRVIPSLKPGVIIHIHDIFLPYEYPQTWIHDCQWFWTEQYLLEAFLSYNSHFKVLWASHYMHRTHSKALSQSIQAYDPNEQFMGSFWIQKVQ